MNPISSIFSMVTMLHSLEMVFMRSKCISMQSLMYANECINLITRMLHSASLAYVYTQNSDGSQSYGLVHSHTQGLTITKDGIHLTVLYQALPLQSLLGRGKPPLVALDADRSLQ